MRIHEGAELIRPGAPLFLKFGPSNAPGEIHPYHPPSAELDPGTARGGGTAQPTRPPICRLPPVDCPSPRRFPIDA
jgi:hypothetical protein